MTSGLNIFTIKFFTDASGQNLQSHSNLDMSAQRKVYFCYSAHILVTTFLCSAPPLLYLSRDATINSDNEVTQFTKSVVVLTKFQAYVSRSSFSLCTALHPNSICIRLW